MQGVRSENCGRPWPHEWEGPVDSMSVGGTENRRFGGFSDLIPCMATAFIETIGFDTQDIGSRCG